MSNVRDNNRTIDKAFKRLVLNKDKIVEAGMKRLMAYAMDYALSSHDHVHWGHRTTGDSYGWALVHNGSIVALNINAGHHGEGEAERQLRQAVGSVSSSGWVGILLASLRVENDRNSSILFNIDYELDLLNATQDEIRDYFTQYFKPISA